MKASKIVTYQEMGIGVSLADAYDEEMLLKSMTVSPEDKGLEGSRRSTPTDKEGVKGHCHWCSGWLQSSSKR